MKTKINKKNAQVTIFVVVGIIIIVGIIAMIYFMGGFRTEPSIDENPKRFIQGCAEEAVRDSLEVILANGGQIVMNQYIQYSGEYYNYLCYSGDYFTQCYNLHPMLEFMIEEELRKDTTDEVQECFNSLREDLENKGFDITGGPTTYSIDLLPGIVRINLKKEMVISKGENAQSFENFDSEVLSPVYHLVQVAMDIVNTETLTCDFNHYEYMNLNPEYHIKKINFDENTFYRVTDRQSDIIFKFAVRNCVLPSGL